VKWTFYLLAGEFWAFLTTFLEPELEAMATEDLPVSVSGDPAGQFRY
jgi:hypothetical protein